MSRYLSNNSLINCYEKRDIMNFPKDNRLITPIYNMWQDLLGKYESMDEVC